MAYRTTSGEVADIISVPLNADLDTFIKTANLLINEELVGKGLTDDRLAIIELWLSAHYAAMKYERGGLRSDKMGPAAESYSRVIGDGIASTRYGEQAIAYDITGTLAELTGEGTATFEVV